MDSTLKKNIENHLEKAEERQLEVNTIKNNQENILKRLSDGDSNFKELMDLMKDTSSNVSETLLVLNGSKNNYKDGLSFKVSQHEKFMQRFFGVIGVVTFIGVSGIIAIGIVCFKTIKNFFGAV